MKKEELYIRVNVILINRISGWRAVECIKMTFRLSKQCEFFFREFVSKVQKSGSRELRLLEYRRRGSKYTKTPLALRVFIGFHVNMKKVKAKSKIRKCSVSNCSSSSLFRTMFSFPTPSFEDGGYARFILWLKGAGNLALLKMKPSSFCNHVFICSEHFSEKQFAGTSGRRLRGNSFPDNLNHHGISEESIQQYISEHFTSDSSNNSNINNMTSTDCCNIEDRLNHSETSNENPPNQSDSLQNPQIENRTNHSDNIRSSSSTIPNKIQSENKTDQSSNLQSCVVDVIEVSTSDRASLQNLTTFVKRKCCALNCKNNNTTSKMHSFPGIYTTLKGTKSIDHNKMERCVKWIQNTGNSSILSVQPSHFQNHYFLCNDHFKPSDFSQKQKSILKRNVIPSVYNCTPLSDASMEIYCLTYNIPQNKPFCVSQQNDTLNCSANLNSNHANHIADVQNNIQPLEMKNIQVLSNNSMKSSNSASVNLNAPGIEETLNSKQIYEILTSTPGSQTNSAFDTNFSISSNPNIESLQGTEASEAENEVTETSQTNNISKQRKQCVKKCSAENCSNTSASISMHRFPTVLKIHKSHKEVDELKKERLLDWLRKSGNKLLLTVDPTKLSSHYFLCSEHFESDRFSTKTLLKHSAVPTIFTCEGIKETDIELYREKIDIWQENQLDNSVFLKTSDEECAYKFEEDIKSLNWTECKECKERHIKATNIPLVSCVHGSSCWEYSSANNMDPEDCPDELKCLTFIEEQLVARVHPLVSVFKLKGLQYDFSQNVEKFASELPHKISDLTSIVTVKYKNNSVKEHDFRVRSDKILNALTWLKSNNIYYKNISISEENLKLLPNDENVFDLLKTVEDLPESSNESSNSSSQKTSNEQPKEPQANAINIQEEIVPEIHSSTVPGTSIQHPDSQIKSALNWPEMDDKPIDEFNTEGYIACAFPTLFPYGKADLRSSRYKTITVSNYFRHLLNYHDKRFATHRTFRYFALNSWMRWSALNDGNIFVRNNREYADMTTERLKEVLQNNPSTIKKVMFQASNIRGTKQYWHARCSELTDMVEQLGMPTFFLTLSAADGHWHDLYRLLSNVDPKDLTESERRKLLQENPLIVDTFFSLRIESFIKHVLQSKYNIIDFWYRIEYQHRGSPHMHGVFWVEGAPDICNYETFSDEKKQEIINYFKDLTTACNPKPESDKPDIHPCRTSYSSSLDKELDLSQLIMTVQRHTRCSKDYCLRIHKKTKKLQCRFKFPFEMQDEPIIGLSDTGLLEFLPARNDPWINRFNPLMLQLWRANIDICPVLSKEALIAYLAKYISKSETSSEGFHELLFLFINISTKCSSTKQAIQKLFIKTCSERDYSAQEVCHILAGHKLYSSGGRKFITVNTSLSQEWVLLSNSTNAEAPQKAGQTFIQKYKARPSELENVSLWNLAANYNFSSGKWSKAKRANIVRVFPKYRKTGEKDELYYHQQVLLHIPWRTENQFESTNQSWENVFKNFESEHVGTNIMDLNINSSAVEQNEEFEEDAGQAEDAAGEMEEWMFAAQLGPNQSIPTIELGRRECDLQFDWSSSYQKYTQYGSIQEQRQFIETHKKNDTVVQDESLEVPNVVFSDEQLQVINYMKKQIDCIKYPNKQTENVNKRVIVQGKAGTGKSLLIKFLTTSLHAEFGDGSYLLVAPTGVAALNINGQTIHVAFHIPINHKNFKLLTGNQARQLCDKLEHVNFLIIDEYSMLGNSMIHFINERCKQAKNNNDFFGGLFVYMFGDIKQLPPVKDTPVYSKSCKTTAAAYGKAAFNSFDKAFFFQKCHCQKDPKFQTVLDNLSVGDLKSEDYNLLSSRFLTQVSTEEQRSFDNAIRLFPTKQEVHSYNIEKLKNLIDAVSLEPCPVARIAAKHNCKAAQSASLDEADGLDPVIYLARNCKIMLRKNLWVSRGLVNGAIGRVVDIIYDINSNPDNEPPSLIICEFESYTGPGLIPGTKLVPIAPILKSWHSDKGETLSRVQFPLSLCYACSIHKSQGLTLQQAFISIGNVEFSLGLTYVALSRVKELSGLLIKPFNLDRVSKLKSSSAMAQRIDFLKYLENL